MDRVVCYRTLPGATVVLMASTALTSQSKTALAKRVASLSNRIAREKRDSEMIGGRVAEVMGGGVAFATAASVGFVEAKYRNKDLSPLSLGPVPLALATAAGATVVSLATGNKWASYAAAGAMGGYGYSMGAAAGAKSRTVKGRKVAGIGDEIMDEELAEHYFGE